MRTEDELRGALAEAGDRFVSPNAHARAAVASRVRRRRAKRALLAAGVVAFGLGLGLLTQGKPGTSVRTEDNPATTPVTPPSATATTVPRSTQPTLQFNGASPTFVTPARGWAMVQYCATACSSTLEATDDGGQTWTVSDNPNPSATGVRLATVSDGYLWVEPDSGSDPTGRPSTPRSPTLYDTHDGGRTWLPSPVTEPVATLVTGATEDWALVGSCQPQDAASCSFHLIVSDDRGRSWSQRPLRVSGIAPSLARAGPAAWVYGSRPGSGPAQLWFSADAGRLWSARAVPATCDSFSGPQLSVVGSQDLWLACSGQPGAGNQGKGVYRSADGGQHWQTVALTQTGSSPSVGQISSSGYLANLVATSDSDAWMVLNRGTVVMTTDRGATWRQAPNLPPPESFFSDMQFLDRSHGWIPIHGAGDQSGLYRTVDGGRTWLRSVFVAPSPP